jgi:hypothetical protein
MIVECITNKLHDIPSFVYDGITGYDSKAELPIEIGQQSLVYGIATIKKSPWYLVDVKFLKYPMYYPSHIFKILDGRISKYWIIKEFYDDDDNGNKGLNISFKELVENEYFYGELLEDNQLNLHVWKKYQKLMKNEFNLE